MVKPHDYHVFLLFHVVTNEIAARKLRNMKRCFMSLGKMLKGLGVQVVFSSVLPVGDWVPRRRQHTNRVNDWLRSWCHAQGFGFYDLGHCSERPGMLPSDGASLTKWAKSVLGSKMAGLISRALN